MVYCSPPDSPPPPHASQVRQHDDRVALAVRRMKQSFGGDSIVLSLAVSQHDRVLNQYLAAQSQDVQLCEALFKQHAKWVGGVCVGGGKGRSSAWGREEQVRCLAHCAVAGCAAV